MHTAILILLALPLTAQIPEVGICQNMENDSLLHVAGYRVLAESIAKCFSPLTLTDEQFEQTLTRLNRLQTKVVACNLFIPGSMKLVGPEVREKEIVDYATIVFQRYQRANIKLIVWGSGGARRVPDGFDHVKATEQFVAIARKLAALAKAYDIVLALENLNHTETNFITTLAEALDVAKKVDHPNLRLNADIYHMLKENEAPSVIIAAHKYIVHCELAERDKRTPPGTAGDDFTPYLVALHNIHYKGLIMLECRWENLEVQARPARLALEAQLRASY